MTKSSSCVFGAALLLIIKTFESYRSASPITGTSSVSARNAVPLSNIMTPTVPATQTLSPTVFLRHNDDISRIQIEIARVALPSNHIVVSNGNFNLLGFAIRTRDLTNDFHSIPRCV